MGVVGIGVDLLHLPRLARVLTKYPDRLARRVLTTSEYAQYRSCRLPDGRTGFNKQLGFISSRQVCLYAACIYNALSMVSNYKSTDGPSKKQHLKHSGLAIAFPGTMLVFQKTKVCYTQLPQYRRTGSLLYK